MTPLLLIACASLALGVIAFRGRTLAAWFAFDLISWVMAFLVWRVAPPFDPYLGAITLGVLKLAAFSVVLATASGVRWSAGRAAAIVAVVYALVIPTQMRTPIDGDEPFYLLVTESLVKDRDFDLANQYRDLAHSETGRPDLVPQPGDPVGKHGELYSRHEPFLPLLLIPGYLMAGLPGAIATIALFGVLLARSTVRLLEDEGHDERVVRMLFPFFAFAPPVVFYATRIWPEVPAAFFFVEALRGVRASRLKRALPALLALVLLKLRFGLPGVVLAAVVVIQRVRRSRSVPVARIAAIAAVIALPLIAVWAITGSALNVHSWAELLPASARAYAVGFAGLVADGASGLAFQAPFYLLGVFAITRWRSLTPATRLGCFAALPYLISLAPRAEWHGGWAPPLRYVVVFMPVLLSAAASLIDRADGAAGGERFEGRGIGAAVALAAVWTAGVTIHGLAFPWRLFHIENGENPVGEWLSEAYHTDVSRLFPSYIRLNDAAIVAAVALCAALVVLRFVRVPAMLVAPAVALLIAAGFVHARTPGAVVEFEDAHVIHRGGALYPELYTSARFLYRCGWRLKRGESLSFLASAGRSVLEYACATPVTIDLGGWRVLLPATGNDHRSVVVDLPRSGRVTLTCVSGEVALDRMRHE